MPAQTVAADVPIAEPPESAQVLEVVAETIVEGGSEHCGKTGDGSGSGAADATSGGLPESPEVLEEVAEKRSPAVAEIANSQSMTKTTKKKQTVPWEERRDELVEAEYERNLVNGVRCFSVAREKAERSVDCVKQPTQNGRRRKFGENAKMNAASLSWTNENGMRTNAALTKSRE